MEAAFDDEESNAVPGNSFPGLFGEKKRQNSPDSTKHKVTH
jgi:hypothetical protein